LHPYRWLGVEHIYLTENGDRPQQHMQEQLQDFIDDGFLTYNHERTPGGQLKVVRDCISKHYLDYDWLSFLDIDEFLVLRRAYGPLPVRFLPCCATIILLLLCAATPLNPQ
jgi:Glycosyl transferase family 2